MAKRRIEEVRALFALAGTIRGQRRARGLTQRAAAKKARVSRRLWQKIEAGEADPRVSTARRIAATLGLHAAALFEVDP